jgi:hypothetical protein
MQSCLFGLRSSAIVDECCPNVLRSRGQVDGIRHGSRRGHFQTLFCNQRPQILNDGIEKPDNGVGSGSRTCHAGATTISEYEECA